MDRMSQNAFGRFLGFRARNASFLLNLKEAISKLLSEEDIDIVHSQSMVSSLAARLSVRNRRPKRIITNHGYHTLYPRSKVELPLALRPLKVGESKIDFFLEDLSLMESDMVTVVSEFLKMEILDSLPELVNRIRVVPAQVDVRQYRPGIDASRIREKLGLGECRVVLYAGRLTEIKGVRYLLTAAPIILREYRDVMFVIAGPVSFSERVAADKEGYVSELSRIVDSKSIRRNVVFAGYLTNEELVELYSTSEIVVVPSIWGEPCCVSILEGMASAHPVVATKVGGNPELLSYGLSGLLVEPKNPIALANAIVSLLSDTELGRKLGRNGRERVVSEFSWEAIARRMEAVYQEVLAL
jgi:glycosyltransferase involved in cell wall biosynthesis